MSRKQKDKVFPLQLCLLGIQASMPGPPWVQCNAAVSACLTLCARPAARLHTLTSSARCRRLCMHNQRQTTTR